MKILFLSHRIPFPPNKGEKIRTFHQLQYLVEEGHQVSVIAPFEEDAELEYFEALEQQYCEKVVGVKLGSKPLRLLKGLAANKAMSVANFYSTALQQQFNTLVDHEQFDAIICTASSMAEYVFKADPTSSFERSALLMDFMDLDSDKWRQYAQRSSLPMKWVYQRETHLIAKFEGRIAQAFNACFFITEAEKALFAETVGKAENIYAVENGMDTQVFKPAESKVIPEQPILLFTGVMDYAPNVDAVVWFVENVWPWVLEKWPKATFYIAGMSPSDKVTALAEKQGIEVTGFVDDIMPYFDKASVFVGPFRIARGVQNKVLQAFACGLPVVSTAMGAEGIRCEDGESILLAHTPEEFIQKLTAVHEDKALAKQLSNNALEIIHQHYAWQGVLQPFDDVLHQVVEQVKS